MTHISCKLPSHQHINMYCLLLRIWIMVNGSCLRWGQSFFKSVERVQAYYNVSFTSKFQLSCWDEWAKLLILIFLRASNRFITLASSYPITAESQCVFHSTSYWQHINPKAKKIITLCLKEEEDTEPISPMEFATNITSVKEHHEKDKKSFLKHFKNIWKTKSHFNKTNLCMWRISTRKGTDFPSSSIKSPWPNLQQEIWKKTFIWLYSTKSNQHIKAEMVNSWA